MTGLRDIPLDLLRETAAALDRYVRARRRSRLRQEQARLRAELQDMRTDLAEIRALVGGVDQTKEEPHA